MRLVSWTQNLELVTRAPLAFLHRCRWPLMLQVVGGILDLSTSVVNVARFGTHVELHLVKRWMAETLGVIPGLPIAKALQVGGVIVLAAAWRDWCEWLISLCGLLYGLAAVSNHYCLI
ncbi:MAG: hypothetical protein ACOC93_04140 [Planctomycetota bacterium]